MLAISLFDYSGNSLIPWRNAGYECHLFDTQHIHQIRDGMFLHSNVLEAKATFDYWIEHKEEVAFMSAFPPCTELASSGAQWWAGKREIHPNFQDEAMELVYFSRDIGEALDCPYYIENPVGAITRLWRKWDYKYSPYEFTGYDAGVNDNYTKQTCLWTNSKFVMPEKLIDPEAGEPDKKLIWNLGSAKRHSIGSITPPGFSEAVYLYNKK